MPAASPTPLHPLRPSRLTWLLGLVLLVLLVHGLFLGLLPAGAGSRWHADARHPVQVRRILQRPAAPVAAPAPATLPPPATTSPPPRVHGAAPAPAPAAAASAAPEAPPAAAPDAAASTALAPAAEAAAPAGASGDVEVPVYATRLPPSVLLRYDILRGALGGKALLDWTQDGASYTLSMEGTAFGLSVIGWHSEGGIDGAGLAPLRFTDRRRGREAQAANFQRDKGLITYSGPAVRFPIVPGAQDRLSWMLQLPAILEATPALAAAGTRVVLFVSGARGDADVWTFSVLDTEAVDTAAGRVEAAVHLHREPRKPYDTEVDVWLDPARSHLPVRVRLTTPPTGDATEFLLREMAPH